MTTKTNSPNSLSLADIPEHLHEYITEQNPNLYTPEDHASWRFIMRVSKPFFKINAHPLYLAGLEATGISSERIPLISEMDSALRKMGWRAVAINGFIPPSIFLEFQSLKILAIACDMRKIENLGYTPSPDIVHEAAGHAPIVADPHYRSYLEAYGQVARNAIISKQDLELYDAIFELSEVKEDPQATKEEIDLVQKKFEKVAESVTYPSEAALLARMAWWTTEYGMVEAQGKPVIYGAGLLSSVLESHHCIHPHVKKIPFNLDMAISTSYDITQPQPQIFVAKDFESLTQALETFADQMCFRRGGVYGLEEAQKAEATVTVVLDSGIQLSGVISGFEKNDQNEVTSFNLIGTKQIAHHEEAMGEFGYSQLGNKIYFPLFDASISTVPAQELMKKLHGSGLSTKSGNRITGQFKREIKFGTGGRVMILEKVKITSPDGKVVFEEKTKPYPFILGSKVTSVFGGAADRKEFALRHSNLKKKVKSHKTNATPENEKLNQLYQRIRKLRESGKKDLGELQSITEEVKNKFSKAWLANLEVLELYKKFQVPSNQTIELETILNRLAGENAAVKEQIQMGLELLK